VSEVKKSVTAAAEEKILATWAKEKLFEQTLKNRQSAPYFSFYDGPPFASGEPHYGHLEQTAVKDSIARYKTMRGFQVPRRTGWDTHGLPIEYIIEKDLGLNSKKEIVNYGIEKFNAACRAIVFRHQQDFNQMYERMGRWADPADSYATLNNDYMESVWWALSQLHQKGLLYRGFKSMPYCPRCQTPLSNFELNEGYKDNIPDPSVFVKFELPGHEPAKSLLAWTTTPWTLPANAALAVAAEADYVEVELLDNGDSWQKGERLILARDRLSVLDLKKAEYRVVDKQKGKDIVEGLKPRYAPLYELPEAKFSDEQAQNAFQVFVSEDVSLEEGTGILHVAPRYGETDLNLGLEKNLPLIESVDNSGHLIYGPEEALGKFFKSADELIIADLIRKGRIFAAESNFEHTYPFCWRCDTPLLYFATTTWFVGVTKIRDNLIKNAKDIYWAPGHIKQNRFGKWLEGARDWGISRNRYWGNPLPIWVNEDDKDDYLVIGSLEELKQLTEDPVGEDLHRPFIDKVTIKKEGKTYRRVEEVLDCWFESGSMSYAQDHYPFENKQLFEQKFPADFIVEGMDQVRLWFYTLHVLATALFEKPAYKNVIADGLILAADGKKLSKRLRNYPPISELLDKYGADTVRLFVLTSPLMNGEDTRMNDDAFRDIHRNLLMTIKNSCSFFKTYADVDKWQPPKNLMEPSSNNVMDQWILARLNQTIAEVTAEAEAYKLNKATRPLFEFIDDLSNWYIRRSRRRFWKSENDTDKEQAYTTLHYVLVRLSQLLAPWAPFYSDELWRELVDGMELPKSVHLSDWPSVKQPDQASTKALEEMRKVRGVITEGLAQRASDGIKVRQPLASVSFPSDKPIPSELHWIVMDELNVKKIGSYSGKGEVKLDTKITDELKAEGLVRELIRTIQAARKKAGLNVEDRIHLKIESDSTEITEAVKHFEDTIFAETLAIDELTEAGGYSETGNVDGQEVRISLSKSG